MTDMKQTEPQSADMRKEKNMEMNQIGEIVIILLKAAIEIVETCIGKPD